MKKRRKSNNCRVLFRISQAGHLLRTKGQRKAGSILASEGKREKKKRLKRGCLNGPEGTFKLTAKQKRNLPVHLQRAILNYHRRQGKIIYD
ncbi:MAG: hypothetical protein ACOZCO_10530 [Bacteroidota bacterium]